MFRARIVCRQRRRHRDWLTDGSRGGSGIGDGCLLRRHHERRCPWRRKCSALSPAKETLREWVLPASAGVSEHEADPSDPWCPSTFCLFGLKESGSLASGFPEGSCSVAVTVDGSWESPDGGDRHGRGVRRRRDGHGGRRRGRKIEGVTGERGTHLDRAERLRDGADRATG